MEKSRLQALFVEKDYRKDPDWEKNLISWMHTPVLTLSEFVLLIRGFCPTNCLEDGGEEYEGIDAVARDLFKYLQRAIERDLMLDASNSFSKEMLNNLHGKIYYRYYVCPFSAIGILLREDRNFSLFHPALQEFLNRFFKDFGFLDGKEQPRGRLGDPKKARVLELLCDLSEGYPNHTAPKLIKLDNASAILDTFLPGITEESKKHLARELRNCAAFKGKRQNTKPRGAKTDH